MLRHLRLIATITSRGLRELWRMPGVLAVIFVPGVVLYSIFTMMFSGGGDGRDDARPAPRVIVVDDDRSPASARLIEALRQTSLRLNLVDEAGMPYDEGRAGQLVKARRVDAALVIPAGGAVPLRPDGPALRLIADETQPMVRDMIGGMVQMAGGMTLMDAFQGILSFGAGRRLGAVEASPDRAAPAAGPASDSVTAAASARPARAGATETALFRIEARPAGSLATRRPMPFNLVYLAGLVPMFLLFNATGAASSMLEEMSGGVTRRILVAPVGAGDYLIGHVGRCLIMSLAQCMAMYVFARMVFHAPIFRYPAGLAALTVATAFATTGFGMLLASLARSGDQLHSLGTVVILAMSAIGGSMFPRAFMPDWVKPLGLFTINGWAYDGFLNLVRGEGWRAFLPQLAVLSACGAVFVALGATLLSRRLRGAS